MKKFFKFITAAVIVAAAVVSCGKIREENPDTLIEKSIADTQWVLNIDLEAKPIGLELTTTLNFCELTFDFKADSTVYYSLDLTSFMEDGKTVSKHIDGYMIYKYDYPTVLIAENQYVGTSAISGLLLDGDPHSVLTLTMTKDYKYLELDKETLEELNKAFNSDPDVRLISDLRFRRVFFE